MNQGTLIKDLWKDTIALYDETKNKKKTKKKQTLD